MKPINMQDQIMTTAEETTERKRGQQHKLPGAQRLPTFSSWTAQVLFLLPLHKSGPSWSLNNLETWLITTVTHSDSGIWYVFKIWLYHCQDICRLLNFCLVSLPLLFQARREIKLPPTYGYKGKFKMYTQCAQNSILQTQVNKSVLVKYE